MEAKNNNNELERQYKHRIMRHMLVAAVTFLCVNVQYGCEGMEPPSNLGRLVDDATDKNMTIDGAILSALGGVDVASNMMLGEGSSVLAELDMYLSMEQFNNMYDPPRPEQMNQMGILPAPIGVHLSDSHYSHDIPYDFRPQESTRRKKRKVARKSKPWTNGEVPYTFARRHFSKQEEYMMRRAMTEWERYTCLKFRPRTKSDPNSLRFQNGVGCNSMLGMRGGVQLLNLQAPGCRYKGLYLHEIGHAVGLVHEHQLPDRDNYVGILYHNVSPHMRIWFNKYSESELTRMKVPYELSSVMHYGITAFSKDGKSQTIQAKDKSQEQRIGRVYLKELAYTDVDIVNKYYRCAVDCPDQDKCGSQGHLDQNCNCICRDGSQDCDTTKERMDAKSCKNNYYSWPCYIWANQGECDRNQFYMNQDCAKACGKCARNKTPGSCKDVYKASKCQMWEERGDCVTNPQWMKDHCAVTCNLCDDFIGVRPEENCLNKHKDEEKCVKWASDGECQVNKAWMYKNCQKACDVCNKVYNGTDDGDDFDGDDMKCENTNNECKHWAETGECTSNPGWMIANCRKACDKCDDGKCKNFHSDVECEIWAQKRDCMTHSKWMGRNCAKSCHTGPCDGTDPSVATRSPTGTTTRGTATRRPTQTPTTIPTTERSCVNKHGSDTQCDVWAKNDHCNINPSWMLKNCARACSVCSGGGDSKGASTQGPVTKSPDVTTSDCRDEDKHCGAWAKSGHCDGMSAAYMLASCRKSCNNCNDCRDAEFLCSVWAKAGHCLKNPRYMLRHCQKSCKACTLSEQLQNQRPDGGGNKAPVRSTLSNLLWAIFSLDIVFLLMNVQ